MSDDVSYHVLGPDNAAVLASADVFDNPVDPRWLADFMAREDHVLVFAMVADSVVGFASGAELLHPDHAPEFFINEVGVNDEWRRRGIATRLVRELLQMARARGCAVAWLGTEHDNDARALYRHIGGRESEPFYMYDWILGPDAPED